MTSVEPSDRPGAVGGLSTRGDDAMRESALAAGHSVGERPDPGRDLALAQQSVAYLRAHGLDDGAVIQCLRDEFEIDLATAEMIAGQSGG